MRYCEAIKDRADYTGSINKRRERRRQRQSMEVLLGLTIPSPIATTPGLSQTVEQTFNIRTPPSTTATNLKSALLQDCLGDVVTDFERTLERSNTGKDSFHSPDGLFRIPETLSPISATHTTVQSIRTGVNGVIDDLDANGSRAGTLRNIRKQMALGLDRIRELEEQVKTIPSLQVCFFF